MSTTVTRARRQVRYESLDDFLADAERLSNMPIHTVGNWSYPQILDHLARTVTASLDGFGFKAPAWARLLIAPFVKNSFLTKTMKAGFNLPKSAAALIPTNDLTLSAAMENLRKALARFRNEPAGAEHPFFGKLASQEWNSLHLRHAELHMSFVVPDGITV
jgi:hypothetical protein